jgi:hypothetical protein
MTGRRRVPGATAIRPDLLSLTRCGRLWSDDGRWTYEPDYVEPAAVRRSVLGDSGDDLLDAGQGVEVTDYARLLALREQALRTRVMVLEDAIRQYLRGWDRRSDLELALGEQVDEEKYYTNPRTEELRYWWKYLDREPLDEGIWMHDPTEVEEEDEDEPDE